MHVHVHVSRNESTLLTFLRLLLLFEVSLLANDLFFFLMLLLLLLLLLLLPGTELFVEFF